MQKIENEEAIGDFRDKALNVYEEDEYVSEYIAPNAKILVVDDNAMNRKVFRNFIKHTQIQLTEASSGLECLELVKENDFDVIFLDHMMPELDGVETTHIIRRFYEEYNNIPIIALTANAVSGTKEMFLREGMNDFVAKPIEVKIIAVIKGRDGHNAVLKLNNSTINHYISTMFSVS